MVKKQTTLSILEPLLYQDEFLHLMEISRKTNVPHTTLRIYLDFFENKGILIKKKSTLTSFKINKLHPLIVDYITIIEKEKLINRCENDLTFREITAYLHKFLTPIIIFGSSVINTKKANDIDILMLKNINLASLEKKLNIKFHLLKISKINMISPTMKNEIIKNHMIINCPEVWIKWMLED